MYICYVCIFFSFSLKRIPSSCEIWYSAKFMINFAEIGFFFFLYIYLQSTYLKDFFWLKTCFGQLGACHCDDIFRDIFVSLRLRELSITFWSCLSHAIDRRHGESKRNQGVVVTNQSYSCLYRVYFPYLSHTFCTYFPEIIH